MIKPITKFQTITVKKGKKIVYVGAYADQKTAERAKALFTQKEN